MAWTSLSLKLVEAKVRHHHRHSKSRWQCRGRVARTDPSYTFLLLLPETSSAHWPASHVLVMQPCGMPCRVSLCLAADASFCDTLPYIDMHIMYCTILHLVVVVMATTTGVLEQPPQLAPALFVATTSLLSRSGRHSPLAACNSIIQKHCEIRLAYCIMHQTLPYNSFTYVNVLV